MNNLSPSGDLRSEKMARVLDEEIAPVWHDRFARLIYRALPTRAKTIALDLHCGTGRTTHELLTRLDNSSKVLALDDRTALVQRARQRVRPEWKERVYFKSGNAADLGAMPDASYNLSVANLVLAEAIHDWPPALRELVRVTQAGGQVLATLPLQGTFAEAHDLFEDVLCDSGLNQEIQTLRKMRSLQATPETLAKTVRELGLSDEDFIVENEEFELLFRSARECLFSPVIEHGPLRLWKAIIGNSADPQAIFWRFKETIDLYYSDRPFAVSVVAGLLRIRIPSTPPQPFSTLHWSRYPSLGGLWSRPERSSTQPPRSETLPPSASASLIEVDVDIDDDETDRELAEAFDDVFKLDDDPQGS